MGLIIKGILRDPIPTNPHVLIHGGSICMEGCLNRHAFHLGRLKFLLFHMGGVDALGAAQQIYVKHGNFGTSLSSSQMGWSGSSRETQPI